MKRVFEATVLSLFLFVGHSFAAEDVPFALTDIDGNSRFGRLVALTPEKIVLQTDDGDVELATKQAAKLENLLRNPFVSTESAPERMLKTTTTDYRGRPLRFPIPVNQPPKTGQVASLIEKKEAEAKSDATRNKLPNPLAVLELSDGSRLLASEFLAKGATATLRLFPQGELALPLNRLLAVRLAVENWEQVFDPPADWLKITDQPAEQGDRMVVGRPGTLDVHEGIVGEIRTETIRFAVDGETLPVPRRKVFGLLFHRSEPPKAERPFGRLRCWNGALLVLKSLELRSAGVLAWTTPGGAEGTTLLDEVAEIAFETTNAVFLTELKPSRVEQTLSFAWEKRDNADASPLAVFQRFQANRLRSENETAPQADPILEQIVQRRLPGEAKAAKIVDLPIPDLQGVRLDGVSYSQGLSIPARTTLVFTLTEPYKTFRARVGIDDRIRPAGRGRLTILGDERLLTDLVLRGDEPSKQVQLDVSDVRKLTLTVDFVDGVSEAATLSLAELKLVKE